jgi:hypothetical protein
MQPGDGIGESSFTAGMLDMPPAPALALIIAGIAEAPAAATAMLDALVAIAADGGEAAPPLPALRAVVAEVPAVAVAALLPAPPADAAAVIAPAAVAAAAIGGELAGALSGFVCVPPQAADASTRASFPAATSGARRMDHSSLR